MTIDQITDHKQRAKDRAPGFMQGATNMELFFDAIVSETQVLETVFFQLLDERHLSVAVGAQLDGIGQILDLTRIDGESDTDYRARLSVRIDELSDSSTIESLISAFIDKTSLVAPEEIKLDEIFPATIYMTWLSDEADPEDPVIDSVLVNEMNALRAGGVRLDIIRNGLTNNFQFSDESELVGISGPTDVEHGFGDEALSDGGQLGRQI